MIVTTTAHSTRARKVFTARLGGKVGLVMHPVPADPFDPDRWWKERTDARQAVGEHVALADWRRRSLWRTVVGDSGTTPPSVTVR